MKQAQKKGKEATIVGCVSDTEEDGELVIITDEDDYFVTMDEVGKRLHSYLDQDVEATGRVTEDDNGNLLITVSSFEALDYEYDDEEEEDDFDYDDDRWED